MAVFRFRQEPLLKNIPSGSPGPAASGTDAELVVAGDTGADIRLTTLGGGFLRSTDGRR